MTTLIDRPLTALVVIDVQNGVVAEAYQRDTVIANIGALVDRAREGGVPIVWVQHSDEELEEGSVAWRYETAPGRTAGVVNTADVSFDV